MRRAALFLLSCCSLGAQPAGIEGMVVNALTGKPLARVHVRLFSFGFSGPGDAYGAMSDRAGRFSIAGVRPGAYILLPERTGFVTVRKKGNSGQVLNITVKPGQHLTDLKLEMTPRAVIMGRVLDEFGDPVQNVSVEVVPVPPDSLPFNLTGRGNVNTDDRGEFRISGPPGKYYIKASPRRFSGGPPEIRTDGTSEPAYGTTYFPSAASTDRAAVVEAKAGEDMSGIDVRLVRRPSLTISGVVTGIPDGGAAAMVRMHYGETPGQFWNAAAGPGGRFVFTKLEPGDYRIYATTMGRSRNHRYSGQRQIEQEPQIARGGRLLPIVARRLKLEPQRSAGRARARLIARGRTVHAADASDDAGAG
jgi:hypothetical protein